MTGPTIPPAPRKLRKQYVNSEHPQIVLRFEDGHEISIPKGTGKVFDAWLGESVKVLAIWDPTSGQRELVMIKKGEEFDDPRS